MHMLSSRSRALLLGLVAVAVVLLAAGCSSSDSDESAEAEPEVETTATETPEPEETETAQSEETLLDETAPSELPTVDVEAALEGIDTDTPPPDGFCEASLYFGSDGFQTDLFVALEGGEGAEEAAANIETQMDDLVELAPPDLEEDTRLITDVVNNYVVAITEAVENDDFVDATEIQEQFAEVADSGARLAAYDEVVCGNPVPGTEGT